MSQCVSICDTNLELDYNVLATGTYTITIVSSLKERYVATIDFTLGDTLTISPFPPLNEMMSYTVYVEVGGGLEEVLYFSTFPYQLNLI